MADKLDALFDDLQSRGFAKDKTREDFRNYMLAPGTQGYQNRKDFFDDFKNQGLTDLGTYEDFAQLIGLRGVKRNQQQTAARPAQTPSFDFAPLDTRQANQRMMGRGAVPFDQQNTEDEPSFDNHIQRIANGKLTPKEQQRVQKSTRQRMDEITYEEETGNRMRQPVKDIQFEAPALNRDDFGNIRRDENGNPLVGFTTDENAVSEHRNIMAEQAEWDSLSAEQKRQRAREAKLRAEEADYTEPTLWDTISKKTKSSIIQKGAELVDFMQQMTSGLYVEDPSSPTGYMRTATYEEQQKNKKDPLTRMSDYLHDEADVLSRQGDPLQGRDFLDLLWDGEIGAAMQKGVGVALESLPMTLSAYNPVTMAMNGILMASGNYRQELLDNPDIPAPKRFAMAVGSAAIEQIVEKYSDPVFKYVGGSKILKGFAKEGAEEIAKDVTKKATETLAQRIFRGLGGLAKDAAGEAAEEIFTDFGNDALGELLDLASGDKDYGIRAQWEQMKKENPNISLKDFAWQKAKEYINDGIAGGMAGAYTSGTTQASVKALQFALGNKASAEDITRNPGARIDPVTMEVAQSYDDGYTETEPDLMKRYNDEAQASAADLPKYGKEFAKMVMESDSPVETLDYLMQNRDYFTDEQITAASDFYQKMSRVNGVMDGALDRIDQEVENANAEVRYNTHQQTGSVITAQVGDRPCYITGGDVVTDEATGMPILVGTGGAVVVRDAETGETSVHSPQEVNITSMTNSDEMVQYNESVLRNQLMQQADDDIMYGSPANEVYQLEDTVTLNDGEGNIIEGQIGMMPNSIDGVYVVYTPDNRALQFTADELNRRIIAHNGMEVQRTGGQIGSQNGSQNVPQTEQTGTDTGEYAPEAPENILNQPQPAESGTDQATGETPTTEESGESNQPQSALSRIPVATDEKGQPIMKKGRPQYQWHKASVEDAAAALIETTGGDMVMARDTASDLIANAKAGLEKIRKQKPKGEDPIEIAESRMEIKRQEQEQQAVIKQWQDVNQAIQKQMNDEAAARQAEAEAAKSEEQRRREAEEARIREEKQREQDRQKLREAIERDREKRNKEYQPLVDARKEMADDADAMAILNDTEPRSIEEWVSSMIRPHSMLWQDSSDNEIGLQSELGLKRADMQRFMTLLGNKESGAKPFGAAVLDIYEGLPDGIRNQYTDEDVRNTLLNLFSEGNSTRMMHLTEENRIAEARETMLENLRRDAEAEMEAWAEAYHLTPEERETYEDFMSQAPEIPNNPEFINQIIELNYTDEEQNNRGQEVDLDNTGGTTGTDSEGGESQVQGQGAAETAAADQEQPEPEQGAETPSGGQAVPGDNVPGGTPEPVRETKYKRPGTNTPEGEILVKGGTKLYSDGSIVKVIGSNIDHNTNSRYYTCALYDSQEDYKNDNRITTFRVEQQDMRNNLDNGTYSKKKPVSPSEQLKPVDLRDATRVESPEIGVAEANAKAREAAGTLKTPWWNDPKRPKSINPKDYKTYMTDEAKEYFANFKSEDGKTDFTKWSHPNLAYITAAAWDGANIPVGELMQIPEIAEAEKRVKEKEEYHKFKISKEERHDLRDRLLDAEHGSAVFENGKIKKVDGKEVFTGPVRQEKKAFVVVGRPAGGKSSVFANRLSNENGARIVDSDVVKPWLSGYDNGYGAGYVQHASADVASSALKKASDAGDNVVMPRIGGGSVMREVMMLREKGYDVQIFYNDVSEETSIMRAASRFAQEGRYLSLDYLTQIKDKDSDIFRNFANAKLKDYYERIIGEGSTTRTPSASVLLAGRGNGSRSEGESLRRRDLGGRGSENVPGVLREGVQTGEEIQRGGKDVSGEERIFSYVEWKSNDVAFGEKPKEIWNSKSGQPMPVKEVKSNETESKVSAESGAAGEGTGQASGSADRTGAERGPESNRAERSGSRHSVNHKRIVSDSRMEELKKRLRSKLGGQLNVGVDPEVLAIGAEMAVGYLERGVTKFADFARTMIEDVGDFMRPYLKSFYNAVRDMPEAQDYAGEMDDYQTVSSFDVYNFDKQAKTPDALTKAQQIVDEKKVRKDVAEITDGLDIKETTINDITDETTEQTAADTAAIVSEAEALAGEARSAKSRERRTATIEKIDEQLEKIDNQLAFIGFYDVDPDAPYHESMGRMKSAEKKAVADATRVARRIAKDLGINAKPTAKANMAPIGGDISFRIPINENTDLYFNLLMERGYESYPDSLEMDVSYFRLEDKNNKPQDNGRYKNYANNFFGELTPYEELLNDVRQVIKQAGIELAEPKPEKKEQKKPASKKSKQQQANTEPSLFDMMFFEEEQPDNTLGATSSPEKIEEEEAKVDTNPTEAQKEAGNYQKGHIKIDGLDITIENPKGSIRRGVEANGNAWEQVMNNTYGYIRGTEGVDGDHIDVFLSDDPTSGDVFIVDQVNPETGEFDEHKVMYGFQSATDAQVAYFKNYQKGWKGFGTLTAIKREAFKEWIDSSHRKTKPFREYALAKRKQIKQQEKQYKQDNNKRNNVGERGKDYAPTSPKARFNANVEAIRLMRQLNDDGIEAPTKDQMEVLRKYSGWGGMGTFFNDESMAENKLLRELLTDEEYNDAVMSINSAYYTPATVIDTLWDVAKALGFKGGNVLEGSAGIGNIIGQMPKEISSRSDIEAVEIDSISGNILKLLYPDAKVHIEGFQDVRIPNGTVDLAVTNVPFVTGLHVIDKVDKDLSRKFTNIHDFCIAKNIRKLREGGVGIFITSSGTMDKSTKLREWIPDEGQSDVIGAFRLNNETFGGTNVTSDIIVVRKRIGGVKSNDAIDISKASPLRVGSYEDKLGNEKQTSMTVNDYFRDHPEMMAGEMAFGYEKGDTFRPGSYGLYPVEGKNQEKMMQDFVNQMKKIGVTTQMSKNVGPATPKAEPNQLTAEKEGRMLIDDKGRLCVSRYGTAEPLGLNDQKVKGHTKQECFNDYQDVQKAVDDVLQQQLNDPDDAALKPKLEALNKAYDKFTKRYGTLHKNTSISFLRNDIDFPSFQALENYSETKDINGKVKVETRKAPLFTQRVLGFKTEPQPENIKDAVTASLFRTNTIDLDWIADKLNKSVDDVKKEILESRLGFEDPSTGQLEVRYKCLSGNVREKLAIAEGYNTDGKYAANVEELRKAVPMDIPSHLIEFSLGSSWIPIELYKDYIKETLDLNNIKLTHVEGAWIFDEGYSYKNEKNRSAGVYSEQFRETIYGHQLVQAALNNRPVKVSKQVTVGYGDNKHTETRVDQNATSACAVRVDEIKDDFKQWAKKKMQDNPELAQQIEKIYNDKFNALVPMQIDDEFLPEHFEGSNVNISLYDHQKRGVMRGLTAPTMLAHEVGTGKSFTLISTAMEMRRLGTAKKPMIVVQNATVAQLTADAKLLYPNAKVLSLTEKDRNAEGRRAFYASIKYNDWDMVIIPQSTLNMIPDSPERELQFIQEKIDEKKHVIEAAEAAGADSRQLQQMKKELEKLEQEYGDTYLDNDPANSTKKKKKDAKKEAAALDKAETKAKEMLDRNVDDVQYFDDLGVDALLVDEAHEYKHLGFQTSIGRGIKGIDPSYSKKCAGLYNKTRAVFEKAGWKNVVFATGTPISNTAAEIWTFMKYLMQPDVMRQNDIYYFDDFVHNFGAISQMLEFATSGKFKENTRFAAYVNKPELIRIWSQVADTVLTKEVGEVKSRVPEKEGGKDQDVFLPQSPSLIRIMAAVRAELERFENMTGKEKKENSSIPLTMYGIAKRAAIDPRLVDPNAPDEPLSKTNAAVKEIVKDLKDTQSYKGTVAVFCDNQNRLGKTADGKTFVEFNIYDDMRDKLIKAGVPAEQIAIIKSGMSITAKQKVFDAVNTGAIRVVLGSTQTLGTGVNMQERLHLLIHMDAPDRPMDYTQRNGRIERQGNLHKVWNKPVRILRFGVEDSLDVTAYQRLKTKSGFIDSIMDGKGALLNNQVDRTVEEEEEGLFDNPVAVLSGSQYALKKNQAERELRKYLGKKAQWEADQVYVANTLRRNKSEIADSRKMIGEYEAELERYKKMFPDGKVKVITVEGESIDLSKGDAEAYVKMAKTFKEKIQDPVNATVKKLRENPIYNDETLNYTVELDGHPINFKIDVYRTSDYENGKMKTVLHKGTRYKSADLQLTSDATEMSKSARECVEDIMQDYISGNYFNERIDTFNNKINRLNEESEQLQKRVGMEFQYGKELEEARKHVDEYTELMKKEMEEKEAKYAAQQKEMQENSSGFDLSKAEDSEEDSDLYRADEDIVSDHIIRVLDALESEHPGFNDAFSVDSGFETGIAELWISNREAAMQLYKNEHPDATGDYYFATFMWAKRLFEDKLRDPSLQTETDELPDFVVDAEKQRPNIIGTDNFKNFFGDWQNDPTNASKVVDAEGVPLILYHSTNLTEVNQGKPFWEFYPGSHFGTIGQSSDVTKGTDGIKKTYPVYLNIRNPKRVNDTPDDWTETHSEWWEKQIAKAKEEGYDGLVYLNKYEDREHPADSWIAFYPEQIKSAQENVGTYNPNSRDIRYRQAEIFSEGETFPIYKGEYHNGFNVLDNRSTYSTDLMPDTYMTEQAMLDALRNQYPEYYVTIEDGNVRMQTFDSVMANAKNAQTAKKAKGTASYVQRKTQRAIEAVEDMAKRMNLDVEVLTSTDGLKGKKARAKGFFNPKTHKITIVLPNNRNQSDMINTLLHEGVAHYGLRKMFGENFNIFLDNVYNNVDPQIKARIDAAMKRNKWSHHTATEEYLARLAERTDFENAIKSGWWQKIKDFFINMLAKAGFNTILTDNELRYILWRSYDNLLHPDSRRNIFDTAREIQMESQLGVGRYARERIRIQRTGETDTSRVVAERVNEEMLNRDLESVPSQELLLSLSQKEGDERNEAINELIRRVRKGDARIVRMGQEMELDRGNDAQIAGAILGGWEQSRLSALADGTLRGVVQSGTMAQGSQAQSKNTSPDSELPIISWAKSTGHYYDEEQVKAESLDKDVYRSGAESRVYRTADGKKVIKFMETWVYYQNPLLKHIDDITLQNSVGFEHLNVLGYTLDKDGRLLTVLEQNFIEGETLLDRYLKENNNEYDQAYDDANLEIDAYLEEVLGLEYVEDEGFDDVHTKNGLLYKDIHAGNVIVDKNGNKHIIDCLVERESDTGKQRADGFSIEDNDQELYSLRTKEPPKKTGIGYKVFVLKNGQLYPPMVANPNGEGTPVGVWLDADAAPVAGTSKTGRPQVKAGGKGTQGGSGQLAYRPGWHLGEIPYALQFNRKDASGERTLFPNNFVWAEVEYADDVDYNDEARKEGTNASGKYQHSLAGLKHVPTDGSYKYRTNPDPRTDPWIITGAMRVNKILSREEVDELVRKAGREPQPMQDGDVLTQESIDALNAEIQATKEADEMGLLYRSDDDRDDVAKQMYEKVVAQDSTKWTENWQDSMVSLKAIQDAIAAETGNVATGAEDAYRFENRMHGRAKNMTEQYDWRYYRPMLKAFNDFCKQNGMTWEQGMDYLIAKSGLERNIYYAFRDAAKAKITDEINEERDDLDKLYAKGRIDEEGYKAKKAELEEREQNGADEFMNDVRNKFTYKHAKQELDNGNISYSEYLRIIERVIRSEVMRKTPKKDSDGNIVSDNYYDENVKDWSGLTETFAKEMYDAAQDVKKQAQKAIDPQERKALWAAYDEQMRNAYITARQVAEDAVFAAENDGESRVMADKLWSKINDATKETLRHSYESGLIDRNNYNKVRAMFDYYIPLRGWEEDKASDVYTYMGRDNVFSPAVKKVWGRTSQAENPLAYIGNIAVSTILSGHRNQMKQHFLNYVMNNPTSLVNISESWYENIGSEDDNPVWILRTADTAGKSADEIAQIVNDFNEEMRLKQKEGKTMPVKGRLRLDVHATQGQKAEHVVEVQRAGHTYQLYINGDPKAAQALNGTAAKAVSRISDTWLGKKITNVNRNMAAYFTSKNPAFVMSNLSRDLNMAGASVAIKEDKAYNKQFIKNVAKVLRPRAGRGGKYGLARLVAGKNAVGFTGLLPSLMRKWMAGDLNLADETERLFGEFMDEGGETGFVNMLSVDSFKEKMQKEIREMNGSKLFGAKANVKETTVGKGLRMLGETFEFYNRCAEDATRFIVYMTSRQMGKTLEESIADAKDVTLNFNRKGTGGMGNAEVRDLFIFVNPAIQALANMYKMATGKPLKFGTVTAAFIAGGALMAALNAWALNLFGDDDDKDAYWNLPPWVRKNNLVFWIPGTKNFVTIPLAQEFRVFYGVGEMVTSAILEHPVDRWGLEIFSSVADLVPINPTGNGGNLMVDFAPTMVQPLMQVGENIDFTGRPIWKENQGNKFAPMYSKAYITTPTWMVKMSEGINDLTGGNEGKKGVIEEYSPFWADYVNNPAVWNHLMQGYFGGMYNTIAKTFDVAVTVGTGNMPKIYQTPVINRFLNRPVERDDAGVLGDDYYRLTQDRDALQYELRVWQKKAADGEEGAQEHVDEILQSEDWKRAEVITHYERIIKDLKAGEKASSQDIDKQEIKESISLYKQEMMEELAAIDGGSDPLTVARRKFDEAETFAERNKLRMRIERLQGKAGRDQKSSEEAVSKALSYSADEERESRDVSDAYLRLATSQNIADDARIKAAKAEIGKHVKEYKQMVADGRNERAASYRKRYQKYFTANDIIQQQSRTMATNKKLLGKGHDAAIMKLIDANRQRMLKAIEGIE